jgi:hydrogenase expression/formation protein HypC
MCVAVSGRIVSIDGDRAKADVLGNVCDVNILLVKPKVGDYVMIHAGCAIEIVKKETHDEIDALLKEIRDCYYDLDS